MGKRIFLYGYYGFGNFGDELLLKSVCENLVSLNEVSQILVRSLGEVSYSNEKVVSTYTDKILSSEKNKVYKILVYLKKMLRYSFMCDELVIGGGGLFIDKGKFSVHLGILWLMTHVFRARSKKISVIGISLDYLSGPFSIFFVKGILKRSDHICVRDPLSRAYAFQISGKDVVLSSDLTFASKYILDELPKRERRFTGISFVDYFGSYEPNESKARKLAEKIVESAKKISEDTPIRYFVFQKDLGLNDKKFIDILERSGIDVDVCYCTHWEKFLSALSECRQVMTMRYHLALMAIRYGIPTCIIDHELKLTSLVSEFHADSISLEQFISEKAYEFRSNNHQRFDLKAEARKGRLNFISWGVS